MLLQITLSKTETEKTQSTIDISLFASYSFILEFALLFYAYMVNPNGLTLVKSSRQLYFFSICQFQRPKDIYSIV